MPHQYEDKRSAASLLQCHIGYSRNPRDILTHAQRAMKLQPSTGPHSARQIDGRQKPAALRVTIGAELRLPMERQKVQPMPQWRQQITGSRIVTLDVEGRREGGNRRRGHDVLPRFSLPDPLLQVFNIQLAKVARSALPNSRKTNPRKTSTPAFAL